MTRQFHLHTKPPIFGEAKNGMKNSSGYPTKLDHWRIVHRERDGDNFKRLKDVHEACGDDSGQGLRELPIRLFSDDPRESLYGFRGWFLKKKDLGNFNDDVRIGELVCGAPDRPIDDDEWMTTRFANGRPVGDRKSIEVEQEDGSIVTVDSTERTVPKARRRFNRQKRIVEPYSHPCHEGCGVWERGLCEIQHTLYFELAPELPHAGKLFVYRGSGIHAQRTLVGSLEMIAQRTGGILANLPLMLEFRQELQSDPSGNQYNMPHPAVVPAVGVDKFNAAVDRELERRRRRFELVHGRAAEDLDEITITGALRSVQTYAAMAADGEKQINEDDVDDREEVEHTPAVPEELEQLMDDQNIPPRKRELLLDKHEGDVEAVRAELVDDNHDFDEELDELFD